MSDPLCPECNTFHDGLVKCPGTSEELANAPGPGRIKDDPPISWRQVAG